MNVKIGNVELCTFEGAYQLKEDDKTLGYYPSFRDLLAAFADTEIGKINAESVGELRAALDRIEKAVAETSLRHMPKFVTETGKAEELNEQPTKVLSLTERTFLIMTGRSPEDSAEDGKLINKIISMHRMADGFIKTVETNKDLYKKVALTYYGFGDEKNFRELPQARELVQEIKAILKLWLEERERQ